MNCKPTVFNAWPSSVIIVPGPKVALDKANINKSKIHIYIRIFLFPSSQPRWSIGDIHLVVTRENKRNFLFVFFGNPVSPVSIFTNHRSREFLLNTGLFHIGSWGKKLWKSGGSGGTVAGSFSWWAQGFCNISAPSFYSIWNLGKENCVCLSSLLPYSKLAGISLFK